MRKMTKQQRIRKINRENKSLTTVAVRKYIDSHYSKNPPRAEELTPLYFKCDTTLYGIIILMKNTSKVLLTKNYIWSYFKANLPNKNIASEEVVREYNERQYQNKIIEQILECSDDEDEKEERLIKKLNAESIQILRTRMGYRKLNYSNSFRGQRYNRTKLSYK